MRHYKLNRELVVADCYCTDRIHIPTGTTISIIREFSTYAECYIVSNVHRDQPNTILVSYSEMENA